jgi:hypothetical protein
MRRAGGRSRLFAWWVALCALGACSSALRSPLEPRPGHGAPAATCSLAEQPSRAGDTAAIVFRAAGGDSLWAARDACAVRLVAEALRPWPTASNDRWTVRIALTDAGATAHRLRGESARDAIDAGLALIATEDLDLVAYAAARPDLEVAPLPWDRTYLRLAPGTAGPLGAEISSDAVRIDARPAVLPSCDTVLGATVSGGVGAHSARVVYEAGDHTARELAERVVALVEGTAVAAVGLGPTQLEAALRAGDELAYIVSVPRSADSECDALATLARRASWIAPHSITPLIDTRAHVIAPRVPQP